MLRLYLFGQFRFCDDQQPHKFSAPPKALPLLACLLLSNEQPVRRETLAFTLWPDETEVNARANVRRHLHHLARALPPARNGAPWLLVDAETAQWNPDSDYWLDVAEFERLSAQPDRLPEAVALYSGDLLEGVYDDWLFSPREQLRALYFADLNQLILHSRAERDYVRALEYARQLLARDPLREDTMRQLIALRYETGDRAGALSEYEHFARRLRRELAVEPMPETTALYESIVRQARLTTETPTIQVTDDAHTTTRLSLPFVGRDAEMEQLRAAWSRAERRRGGMVLIGGESGIGKTRLISELALGVQAQGGRILWGGATSEPLPYQSLVEALRSALPLLAALEIDPLWLAAVTTLVPELRARVPHLPTPAALDPERERARLFESLARCLEGLAQPRPLLLLLDDLHWAGAATIAWLEFIASRLEHWPVLIVCTYREEETAREHPLRSMRRRLQKENLASHLALGRLGATSVQQVVERVAPELAPQWFATSEGNPFFLGELIRDWIESGKTTGEAPAPSGVQATIIGRFARVSPTAKTLCEVASVVGPSFDTDLVREVAGWSEAQTLDALDELLDHQLVREAGRHSGFDYVFTHHLIQAAIYATIPKDSCIRRHRRVARVMQELSETQGDEWAGELASHWDRGGEPALAAETYLRAARHALAVYADGEALTHLDRSIALADAPRLRADLFGLREAIYARRGERAAQRADLDQLRELAQSLEEEDWICESLGREIRYQRTLGDRQAEAALIESLQTRAAASGLARWQAQVLREQATYRISLSQYDAASPIVERALALYQSLDDAAGQVQCLCLRGEIGMWQGRLDVVQASLERARAQSQAPTNQSLLIQTLRAASAAAFVKEDFQAALDLGTQMLELSRRVGDLEGEADALTRLGTVETRLFQIASARERYDQAAALYDRLGKRQGQAAVLINSGLLAANRLGRYAEGLEKFRRGQVLFEAMNDVRGQMICVLNLGMTAFFLGDFTEAKAAGERGLTLAREMNSAVMEANALANLGAAERELGELSQAIEHMRAGLALRRRLGQPADLGTDLTDLTLAYLRAGNLEAARPAAEEMMALYRSAKESMVRAEYMLWVAAQTFHALGEMECARDLLAQAYTVLKEKAAAIPDEESRASFLDYPFNREIITAWEKKPY